MRKLRLLLAPALILAALVLAPATAMAAPGGTVAVAVSVATPALGPDCKGDPPTPNSPYGLLTAPPANPSTGDPFTNPDTVSIQSVYGTNFRWWVYDNGCAAGSDIMPKLGSSIGQLIGLEIPGLIPSWGSGVMSAVVNPTWTAQLDSVVEKSTASAAAGVWYPWLTVALLVVAVLALTRALRGALPAVITGVVWALLVLVVVSWTVSYPTESTKLLDSGIQTAVTATANGFFETTPATGQSTGQQAQAALDHEWDVMVRSTLYRSWLQGAFGNPDSATAQKYGPDLFKATHFSWHEWDVYTADPSGAGKSIVDTKAASFRQVADQVQAADPVAYDSFTGNNYWDRVGVGVLSLIEMITVAWFMLAAGVIILLAYLLARLVVPIAPVAGVFFLADPLRDMAVGWLRRVAGLLVMGPLFFLAALVVGRFNTAILSSQLNTVLKLIFVGAVAVVAWKLLRPASMVGRLRVPGGRAVTNFIGSKFGAQQGVKAGIEDEQAHQHLYQTANVIQGPVFIATGPGSATGTRAGESQEPIVFTATSVPSATQRAAQMPPAGAIPDRPGTFAPRREALISGAVEPQTREPSESPGSCRVMSSTPTPRTAQRTTPVPVTYIDPPQPIEGSPSPAATAGTRNDGSVGSYPIASAEVDPSVNPRRHETASPAHESLVLGSDPNQWTHPVQRHTEESPPLKVHEANLMTDPGTGQRVFRVYNPERDPAPGIGGVVYGS